jgi:hypothetical protein
VDHRVTLQWNTPDSDIVRTSRELGIVTKVDVVSRRIRNDTAF